MTKLPFLLEQRKNEMAAAVAVLKSLLSNPDDFGKLDALGASDILAGRLAELEQRLAALENATGVSPEVIEHVQNIGVVNPHNITYLILGVDLGGLTFTNAGNAVNPTDIPNLQQVQALIESTLEYSDLTAYEPAFDKNTAFNKNFGNTAGTVAEGNHTHDYFDYLDLTDYEPAFDKNTAFNKNFGTGANTVAVGNHTHDETYAPAGDYIVETHLTSILADYEPLIGTKGSAFNKNFGTIAGSVAEGNHTHSDMVVGDHNHDDLYEPKNDNIQLHIADVVNNPHQVTAAQIGAEPAFTKATGFNLPLGTTAGTVAEGNHFHDFELLEPKTAFNKDFGTEAGTVAEGNHTHSDMIVGDHTHDDLYEPKNDNIQLHIANVTSNPHQVTVELIGAEPAFTKETGFNLPLGTEADTVAEGNHIHDFVFEEMNTAFNKNFGTAADTVAEGNHEHNYNYGGTTRPAAPILYQPFFDVNLGKPIWFNGASWVDAMGNVI